MSSTEAEHMATAADDSTEKRNVPVFPVPIYYDDVYGPDLDSEKDSSNGRRPGYESRGRSSTRRGNGPRSARGRGHGGNHETGNSRDRPESSRDSGRGRSGCRRGRNTNQGQYNNRGNRGRSGSALADSPVNSNAHIGNSDAHNNENSMRNRRGSENKHVPILGYKRLEEMAERDDPDELLLEITTSKSGFEEYLKKKDLNPDWLYLILKIISIATKSLNYQSLRDVLKLVDTHLLSKITETFSEIMMRSPTIARYCKDLNKMAGMCLFTISLLKSQLITLPSSLGKCNLAIMSLRGIVNMYNLHTVEHTLPDDLDELDSIKDGVVEERQKITADISRSSKQKTNSSRDDEDKPPPDNFREIPILPCLKDLQWDDKPFLRAHKAKGKYDGLDSYLDIQFRLLREDYIQPLRLGIKDYRAALMSGGTVKKLRNLRLYHRVQLLRPICGVSGINYIIQFDVAPLKGVNWQASRRLLFGSLVCMTKDDFQTNVFATVTEHKASSLQEGQVQVRLENENASNIGSNDTFIMAETTAYFEAYRHILRGLQEIDDNMPFQQYIVACANNLRPPRYLLPNPHYEFGCLLTPTAKRQGKDRAPVLTTTRWPDETDLSLDESQLEALKLAITKELAIIQGPPGTGKTHVGLKITELLMANKHHWRQKPGNSPILVVCYTNHALDQFLEGMLSAGVKGIVRVGGRCNNDALEPYTIANLKKVKREEKSRSWVVHEGEKECKRTLWECQEEIAHISSKLKATTTHLIRYQKLEPFMTDEQIQSFRNTYGEAVELANWLGIKQERWHDEDNDTTSTADIKKFNTDWKEYILKTALPIEEGKSTSCLSILEIHPRARAHLYKSWVKEYIESLESSIAIRVKSSSNTQTDDLFKLLESAKTRITDAVTLHKYVLKKEYRKQLQTFVIGGNSLEKWLFIDESNQSTEFIQFFMAENLTGEDCNTDTDNDDLEEAREVDEDDDNELLYAYSKEISLNISKAKTPEESWQVQMNTHMMKKRIRRILSHSSNMTHEQADSITDVMDIAMETRYSMYCVWLAYYKAQLKDCIHSSEEMYMAAVEKYREIMDHECYEILSISDVIGMTTTGAAKNRNILQKLGPKIIIVEEAAEVLESHIITTLNDKCQHLILIGDHKQLRPSPAVYDLAKKYNLDISLFERMVNNNVPCVTLSQQHRMRPEISSLMRHKNLYPHLRDHTSVRTYDNVLGINGNVRFIHHEQHEQQSKESTSYFNSHEAKYLAALCKYILKQGYLSEQITVLTPYMGQVFTLRKEMPKSDYEGVRITAVDNFQGEENDIILVSLVRSSSGEGKGKANRIGFLGIENRVCVALSRARKGLYVIGNFKLLAKESNLWKYMVETMQTISAVSEFVELRCQNHPVVKTEVSAVEDFKKAPEGGCTQSCNYRLPCGHLCPKYCHVLDKDHKYSKCWKPCVQKCPANDHPCKKKCWQNCGKCVTTITKTVPM